LGEGIVCAPLTRLLTRLRSCSARIMVTTKTMADVVAYFRLHARQLERKARFVAGAAWEAARSGC
jgi:hypothetical protein